MSAVVQEARNWLGTPYLHQGTHRGHGCDCLGLIRGVWRATVGAEPTKVPTYTPDWSEPAGKDELLTAADDWLIPADDAPWQAGQIVLFRMRQGAVAKHLGILTGLAPDMHFIHAYSGHGVIESPLSSPWRRKIVARFSFPIGD